MTHRYLFMDLRTRTINLELPMFGVTYSRRLNKVGNANTTFALGTSDYNDADIVEATAPGRTALLIERNGSLSWGGIVWTRTYESQGHTIQFNAQTFESYAYKQFIETDIRLSNTDQREVVRQLFIRMAQKPYADIGIQVPGAVFTGGILRTVNFFGYEGWTFGKAIEYMLDYSLGMDYTLEVAYENDGSPAIRLMTDNILGAPISTTQMVLEYPGNIKNYWWPEKASDAVTDMLGFGANEGIAMVRTKHTLQEKLNAGYPSLQGSYDNKDVSVVATLASQTYAAAVQAAVPIVTPTFETNPSIDPQFGTYNIGDYAFVKITDPRFPEGKQLYTRIIGWNVVPASSTSQEEVKLVVAGEGSE